MRKVILFIAMSLDGYIADSNGGVGWLNGQDPDAEGDDSYCAFIRDVDTVVMGWNTYHQIVTELSPEKWVYSDLTCHVITHRTQTSPENIHFTHTPVCDLVRELRQAPGKAIWICGGANIIHPLIQQGLIDEYDISIIPTILGSGIRLFGETAQEIRLRLTRTHSENGITELIYVRR